MEILNNFPDFKLFILLAIPLCLLFLVYLAFKNVSTLGAIILTKMEGGRIKTNNFEKNVVYLFQMQCTSKAPNSSPHCLTVEAWLKYHKIPYVPVYSSMLKSKTGQIPYIIFNGEEIDGPKDILDFLKKVFNIKPELSEEDEKKSKALEKMIDEDFFNELMYFNIYKNKKLLKGYLLKLMPEYMAGLIFASIYGPVKQHLDEIGMLELPENEVYKSLEKHLVYFDEILGEKKYLFGNEATEADFALFALLLTSFYGHSPKPLKTMFEKVPKLKIYMEEMLYELYPRFSITYK
uniref:Glutathione S-transferase n=1 Tax=Panagrolaimus sp. JU765 TaxID=591449 RepID=A0AC34QSF5_9BILA